MTIPAISSDPISSAKPWIQKETKETEKYRDVGNPPRRGEWSILCAILRDYFISLKCIELLENCRVQVKFDQYK